MVIHMQQKKENDNIMNYDTVRLDDENNAIIIIDQTKLPGSIELIALKTAEEIWDAIYLLRVRGAPAIGVAAAFGIYLLAKQGSASDYNTFHEEFVKQKEYLEYWNKANKKIDNFMSDGYYNAVKSACDSEIISLYYEFIVAFRNEHFYCGPVIDTSLLRTKLVRLMEEINRAKE